MVERLVRQMVTSISAAAAVSALRRTSSSIGPSWDMAVPIKSRVAARDEVAAMLDRRGPAGAEQDRRVGFLDERRAGDRRRQRNRRASMWPREVAGEGKAQRHDLDRISGVGIGESPLVQGVKARQQFAEAGRADGNVTPWHQQLEGLTMIAHVGGERDGAVAGGDAVALALAPALFA